MSSKRLMEMVTSSNLNSVEIQALIDVLLNKQGDNSQWKKVLYDMERHTCLMIFIFIIYGGFSLYAVVTSLYAVTYSLYSVPRSLYEVHVILQTVLFSLYAVLTAFCAVIVSSYVVFFLLCAVANLLYAVLFILCTEVTSLYAVPFSCKVFSRYMRCFFHYVRWLFHYTRCFFHYIHGTSFSLDLKRGQLRMEVKIAATTRILKNSV